MSTLPEHEPTFGAPANNIETIVPSERGLPISRELGRLSEHLRSEFPQAKEISFEFTDRLRLHLDVRTLEEANLIKARLPSLCSGIFSEFFSGSSPRLRFSHRVSARVEA